MSAKILVVDDERSIAEILKYNLEKEGFEVILAYDGEEALERLEQDKPDLILLDIMLPKKDGFAVCREIRAQKEIPIIMLTARETEVDKVLGLELGADDYVTKPFSAREVTARVKAILRRTRAFVGEEKKLLRHGDLVVDLDAIQVFNRGRPVELTPKEFSLLSVLMRRPGHVFDRQQLLNQAWGYDYFGDERTVDVTIRRLREKLELNPSEPEYIHTKRGVGYYFKQKEQL
ncbi:MAG TPA: response regulator [Bacillota bacterium]|nr:response regulator [Bacillota bacterium]HOB28642.1 response regulator [Bacillota bacterium]HPZ41330.1 response regulator [Bacillota bacterium]HQD52361.1 response regulator [Bacillota bacterium]